MPLTTTAFIAMNLIADINCAVFGSAMCVDLEQKKKVLIIGL